METPGGWGGTQATFARLRAVCFLGRRPGWRPQPESLSRGPGQTYSFSGCTFCQEATRKQRNSPRWGGAVGRSRPSKTEGLTKSWVFTSPFWGACGAPALGSCEGPTPLPGPWVASRQPLQDLGHTPSLD